MTILSFKAPGHGKMVKLNSSLTKIALIEDLTKQDIKDLIRKYEAVRLDVYWREKILAIDEETGITGGFSTRLMGQPHGTARAPKILKSGFLQRVLNCKTNGRQLLAEMEKTPVADQIKLLTVHQPRTREDAEAAIAHMRSVLDASLVEFVDDFSSIQDFFDHLVEVLTTPKKSDGPLNDRASELLAYLWDQNLILFPGDLRAWRNKNKWSIFSDSNYCAIKHELANKIFAPTYTQGYADKRFIFVITCFACSTISSTKDISPELMEEFELIAYEGLKQHYSSKPDSAGLRDEQGNLRTACIAFLKCYNVANPSLAVDLEPVERKSSRDSSPRVDGQFLWLSELRPELVEWADCFRLFIKSLTTARVATPIDVLNKLGDFLCTLELPPTAPWLIERRAHIYDASTINKNNYFNFLLEALSSTKRRNSHLSTLRKFFTWTRDYLDGIDRADLSLFPEPILITDTFGRNSAPSRTYRDSLPPYIINEMKGVITDNDFEFPRSYGQSEVSVFDIHAGQQTRVFHPGLAICLYTMLELPIRSHQSRWLDSGELDEFAYIPTTKSYQLNQSPHAIRNRNESVLRLHNDGYRADQNLTMWINTNKTSTYSRQNAGYQIPYVSPKLEELINTQIAWQSRYLPPMVAPLEYRVYQDDVRDIKRENIVDGPTVCPLFRDPNKPDNRLPLAYQKLARFYTRVLERTEKRIFDKYGQRLKLVARNEKGELKWIVDLHTLRVSGISNLIEAGVPLKVVQMFVVDHEVLVSTLHYLKYSPAKLREFLELATEQQRDNQNFVGSEIFARSLEELAPFLVTPNGAGKGAGIDALMLGDGVWTINPDGICPGTSCSNGGAFESSSTKHGPVPGGQRCGLCRFWITGPAHVLGQIVAVNNLAYAIRKKGLEIARINDLCIDAEDEGRQGEARRLRDRVDLLNRELEIDINEWVSRHDLAQQSIEMLNAYMEAKSRIIATDANQNTPVPFMTKSDDLTFTITMEQSHEFSLLDQITQMSDFTTGFTNREAEFDKHQILSKMMVANGIQPFLLTLNEEEAHEAGNLLSALILQRVDSSALTEVLSGTAPLNLYPSLEATINALAEGASEGLSVDGISRIATKISEKHLEGSRLESSHEPNEDNDEDENEEESFG